MLTPDYFYGKSDRLVEMYQELEDWILQDTAQRIIKAGEMAGTTDRNLWMLRQMGMQNDEIVKKIAELSGKSKREIRRILRQSVMTSFEDDKQTLGNEVLNPAENNMAVSAANAEMQKTYGELDNLTRTTMLQAQSDLLKLLNDVDYRVASGMQSYTSAVCEVLDKYAQKGIAINYPTGTKRSLEAAVRCCIVTSMNQTAAQVTNQYIAEYGVEYVLVSAHMGARHSDKNPEGVQSHDYWQGKVYKISGSEEGIPNLTEATGYSIDPVTGQGKVVNPLGLHGYNCRHSHKPWSKNLKNPYVDENGKPKIDLHESRELYDKQQKQRAMERGIRQTKRELLMKRTEINKIAETDVREILQPQYDELAYKLRMQNKAYDKYCEDNNLQKQSDRIKVAGFNRTQADATRGRATAYGNANVENIKKSGAISGAVYNYKNDPDGSKRQKIAEDLYSQTRNRNSEYEIKAVAQNSGMSEVDVKKIYNHIYVNKHLFQDGTIHLFDPDYEMAQSWQRLRNNNQIQPHDITLLKHELAEYNVMGESLDIAYEPIHNEVVKTYNYQKELIQYLKERGRE